jgi:hypothetical protein
MAMKLKKSLDSIAFGGKTYREIFIEGQGLINNQSPFNNTNSWTGGASTLSISNGLLLNTADGTNPAPFTRQIDTIPYQLNAKIYLNLKTSVNNNLSTNVLFTIRGTTTAGTTQSFSLSSPVANQIYNLSAILQHTDGAGFYDIRTNQIYSSNANANGKIQTIYHFYAINLTALFGAGNEPTKAQMDTLFAEFQEAGSVSVGQFEQGQGKNLFDGITADVEVGNVMSSTPVGSTYLQTQVSGDTRLRVIELIPINPNTQYTVSVSSNYDVGYLLFDTNKLYTGNFAFWSNSYTITTSSTERYIALLFRFDTNVTITPSEITSINAQLELGNTATTYEPYKYLAIHNPASNDIPIPALNNLTLNEVFVGGNVVLNPEFTSGTTSWFGLGSETLSVNDGIMTVTSSVAGSQVRLRQSTPIVNVGEIFYFNSFVKVNQTHSFNLARPFSVSLNPTLNQFTFISTLGTSTSTEKLRFGYGTSNIGDSFDVKYVNLYNLTSLGIASVTQAQLDNYYQAWQRNNAGTLLANTFIQHDQNSVPIADLNGKTLDEVFIGGQLVNNGDFNNGTTNWTTSTSFSDSVSDGILTRTRITTDNNNLADAVVVSGEAKYYVGNYYFAIRHRVNSVNNPISQRIRISATVLLQENTTLKNQWVNFSSLNTLNTSSEPFPSRLNFAFVYDVGSPHLINDTYQVDYAYTINLTALGITATKEQLDFWYSVWQQNHKLGMRVHRASGNDIPLAVLNNQSLNQVFVGGQYNLTWSGTGVTNFDDYSLFDPQTTLRNYTSIQNNYLSSNSLYYIKLLNTFNPDATQVRNFRFFDGTQYIEFTPFSNNYSTLFNNISATRLGFDHRYFTTGYTLTIKKPTTIVNLTSLGIATLTKSQLDYLFTVWQFNTLNALVARQFIQEA